METTESKKIEKLKQILFDDEILSKEDMNEKEIMDLEKITTFEEYLTYLHLQMDGDESDAVKGIGIILSTPELRKLNTGNQKANHQMEEYIRFGMNSAKIEDYHRRLYPLIKFL